MSLLSQMKLWVFTVALLLPIGAAAQDFSAIARLDVAQSGVQDRYRRAEVTLGLSQPVPYFVYTLENPKRLVIDFREVDFRGVDAAPFTRSNWVSGARFGPIRVGWSRMILELAAPVRVDQAGMVVDEVSGTAQISVVLRATSEEDFAAQAGFPNNHDWDILMAADPVDPVVDTEDGPIVIVIDPGHGGIDPGAEYAGVREADVMLALALELADALGRIEGVQSVVTRNNNSFVPLQERLTLARRAGADLFISLHADALEGEQATGASVYTLTHEASEEASQRMAERHDGSDLITGVDLSGQGDEVATVLQDLVRVETAAAAKRFAEKLFQAMSDLGVASNSRFYREAELAVLNAADFPSVLLEVGFLSNPEDRERLTTPQGRAPIVAAVTLAVGRWAVQEEVLAPLIRQ